MNNHDRWVKSEKQKEWHCIEDFSYYGYASIDAEAVCGLKYDVDGHNSEIISEVVKLRPPTHCQDCANNIYRGSD